MPGWPAVSRSIVIRSLALRRQSRLATPSTRCTQTVGTMSGYSIGRAITARPNEAVRPPTAAPDRHLGVRESGPGNGREDWSRRGALGATHRLASVLRRRSRLGSSKPRHRRPSLTCGNQSSAAQRAGSHRVPTIAGHGLHFDASGGEELTDLGCVFNDVQRHAGDNHSEQGAAVSMCTREWPSGHVAGEGVKGLAHPPAAVLDVAEEFGAG